MFLKLHLCLDYKSYILELNGGVPYEILYILFFFLSFLVVLTPLYAATQTLTTYYPAPQGNYKNMQINNTMTMTSQAAACGVQAGTNVVFVDDAGLLYICDKNGVYTLTNNELWAAGATNMYPANIAQHVDVGAVADLGPGINFGVTGTAEITSFASVGGAQIGVNTFSVNGTADITGNTIIGGTASITGQTSIAGAAIGANKLTVNGASEITSTTSIGGLPAGANMLTVNGAAEATTIASIGGAQIGANTLSVTGTAETTSFASVGGAQIGANTFSVNGTADVSGNTIIGGNATVTGPTSIAGAPLGQTGLLLGTSNNNDLYRWGTIGANTLSSMAILQQQATLYRRC